MSDCIPTLWSFIEKMHFTNLNKIWFSVYQYDNKEKQLNKCTTLTFI